MSRIILAFLQLFRFVRDLQARHREAIDARIEAERRLEETQAELNRVTAELAKAKTESSDSLKAIADVLCRRFLGQSLAATPTVEEVEAEDDPALAPLNFSPRYELSSKRAARVRSNLQRELNEYFADPEPAG